MIKKVDEKLFETVKLLLTGGGQRQKVADLVGVSIATVGRIAQADTYQDYLALLSGRSTAYAERTKNETSQSNSQDTEHRVTIVADRFMAEKLDKQIELLTVISNKLIFIVEALQ